MGKKSENGNSKRLIVSDDAFMDAFAKVYKAEGTTRDVASELGVDPLYVSRRATALRRQGVELPKLGKSASKDWDALRQKAAKLFA